MKSETCLTKTIFNEINTYVSMLIEILHTYSTYGYTIRKGIKHALQFQKAKLFVAQSEPLT